MAVLEARIAALESGAGAVCYASGMAAVTALFLSRLKAGDHLVLSDVCYAGVAELARDTLSRFNIDITDRHRRSASCRTGASPRCDPPRPYRDTGQPDLKAQRYRCARRHSAQGRRGTSVNSTIATPVSTQPIALGADYVVHSLTKYICAHGDAMGGAIVVRDRQHLPDLRQGALVHQGAALHPFAAWLLARGLGNTVGAHAYPRSKCPRGG